MGFVQGGFLIQFVLTWEASWQWQVKITCLHALWTFLVLKMAMEIFWICPQIFAIFDDFYLPHILYPLITILKKSSSLESEKIYSNYINDHF